VPHLLDCRRAGVLLHPTSLPGPGDSGVLGASAARFIGLVADAGFTVWQTLPLGPVGDSLSPYQTLSVFAGDPRLIDLDFLVNRGWLSCDVAAQSRSTPARLAALDMAWDRFRSSASREDRLAFADYWQRERSWLLPYCLFMACRQLHGDAGWWTWPAEYRDRQPAAMRELMTVHQDLTREFAFQQFVFDAQWTQLRRLAASRGVRLFGDVPIYVALDSADTWWYRKLFRLQLSGMPQAVAGVPPDYFSEDGQVWGNPLYDWPAHAADGFRWWCARIRRQLKWSDVLRLDHFRGLQAYWEVPAAAKTARGGCWREGPGASLLSSLKRELGHIPLVAEDLGVITPDVRALRDQFDLPGMLILQFAFDGSPTNPYLPANHRQRAVVYTGTHDNDTLAGWLQGLDGHAKDRVRAQLGLGHEQSLAESMLEEALRSPAALAVLPWQDVLGLGSEARMNTPGIEAGNWRWRFRWEDLPDTLAATWRQKIQTAGRLLPEAAAKTSDLYSAA
jgi:4-alpha-glucanotransferase